VGRSLFWRELLPQESGNGLEAALSSSASGKS
jgi:hypothetical protein